MSWEVKKYKALENLQFVPSLNKHLPAALYQDKKLVLVLVKVVRRNECEPICIVKYLQNEKNTYLNSTGFLILTLNN